MAKVMKGQVVDGYQFQGGDPNDQNSWKKVDGGSMPEDLTAMGFNQSQKKVDATPKFDQKYETSPFESSPELYKGPQVKPRGPVMEAAYQDAITLASVLQPRNTTIQNLPPEPPGIGKAVLAGAGRSMDRIVAGGAQGYLQGRDMLKFYTGRGNDQDARTALDMLAQEQQAKEAAYAPTKAARPIATAIGENWAALAPPSLAPVTMGRAIVSPALRGAASKFANYGTLPENVKGAIEEGVSNAAGGLVGGVAANVIRPGIQGLSQAQITALRNMEAQAKLAGTEFKPSFSELSGSKTAKGLEDMLGEAPGSAGIMGNFRDAQQRAMNTVANRSIGQGGNEVNQAQFDAAASQVDQAYKALRNTNQHVFEVGPDLVDTARSIIKNEKMKVEPNSQLMNYANRVIQSAGMNTRMSGAAADTIRKEIAKNARDATGSDANAWGRLLNSFDASTRDSAAKNGLSGIVDNLDQARAIYQNLLTLDRPNVTAGGNVRAKSLRSAMVSNGNNSPELGSIGEYAAAFPSPGSNSKTFARANWEAISRSPLTEIPATLGNTALATIMTSPLGLAYARNGLMFNPAVSGALARGAQYPLAGMTEAQVQRALRHK